MKQFLLIAVCFFNVLAANAQTLGSYPSSSVVAGKNITITPGFAPTNTVRMSVFATTEFHGVMTARSTTGVITIVDAKPAGTYTIKVKAFSSSGTSVSKTFTLVVDEPDCSQGQFMGNTEINTGLNQLNVIVGDFNRDGKQDLAAAHEGGVNTLSIRMGNGNGGFTGSMEYPVGSHPFDVAIGDFDRDGFQDLTVANSGADHISILLGNGSGGFVTNPVVTVGNTPVSLAVGDFNNDEKQDIAVANLNDNSVSIRIGDGFGYFSGNTEVPVGKNPFSIIIGDFDNNGNQDIATANSGDNSVSIRLGNGSGGFSGSVEVPVGLNPYCVTMGDFDEDGNQDIATASFAGNVISLRLGDGNGNFSGTTEITVGMNPYYVTTGNFNGDEHLDIATANYFGNSSSIRFGAGDGSFSGNVEVPAGSYPTCVIAGEFNNDNLMDLAISNLNDRSVSIRLGRVGGPSVHIMTSNSPVCEGEDLELGISGGDTYSWTGPNGFTSTADNILIPSSATTDAGFYAVSITDSAGCVATLQTLVEVNPLPFVSLSLPYDTVCSGDGTIILTGGIPANGTWSGTGVNGSIFNPMLTGPGGFFITYTYTDLNGCTSEEKKLIHVELCAGTGDNFEVDDLSFYPVPANDILYFSKSVSEIEIFNIAGEKILSVDKSSKSISLEGISNGVYFIRAGNRTSKFIVMR